jgi:diaminopimelate epimerase
MVWATILSCWTGASSPAADHRRAGLCHADRHRGIGCDQLIVLDGSALADFRMRFFNADGSESGACGNGQRAIGLLHGAPARIETAGGIATTPTEEGISVDMGEPRLDWQTIPLAYAMDTLAMPVGWEDLQNPWR